MKIRTTLAVGISAGAMAFTALPAAAELLTFDELSASAGPLTGAVVTNYLSSHGVTLSDLTPGSVATIQDYSGVNWATVPSSPNVFIVGAPSPYGATFTMNFAGPVSDFSFSTIGHLAAFSPSGTVNGNWSATAYDTSHTLLGSVGQPLIATYADVPSATWSLSYSNISSIVFYANAQGWAGTQMPQMDNISFTAAVPEPETYAMLLAGLGLLGFETRRRRKLQRA